MKRMASDNSGLIKLGIAGAVGWYAYTQGWLSFLGIGSAAASTPAAATSGGNAVPPTPAASPAAATPSAPTGPSLTSLYSQLVAAVGPAQAGQIASGGARFGPDDYNAILTGIYPAAGPLPDPNQLFGASGWSRPSAMPIATYWAATSAWLQQNKGLSGLNGYAGLGALAARWGR